MVDANRHLRHSAYADFAAQTRIELLKLMGFDQDVLKSLNVGPILFREELIYKREINLSERIQVTCLLSSWNPERGFWSFRQEILKADGALAAIVNVDGAWLDLQARKLTALPTILNEAFAQIPRYTAV